MQMEQFGILFGLHHVRLVSSMEFMKAKMESNSSAHHQNRIEFAECVTDGRTWAGGVAGSRQTDTERRFQLAAILIPIWHTQADIKFDANAAPTKTDRHHIAK